MKFAKTLLIVSFALLFWQCKREDPALAFDSSLIKPTAKYDVADYFLLLPYQALPQHTTAERRKLLETANRPAEMLPNPTYFMDVLDRQSGYLRLSMIGGGHTDQYEVTYWTQPGKPDTVGINYNAIGMPGTSSTPTFYRFVNNEWSVITKEVFPSVVSPEAGSFQHIIFPQKGTDIIVNVGDSQKRIAVLQWKDGKFISTH